jgi:hypothetical protein
MHQAKIKSKASKNGGYSGGYEEVLSAKDLSILEEEEPHVSVVIDD